MKEFLIIISLVCFLGYTSYSQHNTKFCSDKGYQGYIFDTSYLVLKSILNQERKIELSCNDLVMAEQLLKKNLKSLNEKKINQGKGCPNINKKLCKYYRQYFGFKNKNGESIIWINLFWNKSLIKQAQTEIISVHDGCSYYWNIEVNLSKGILSNLNINGKG